jgi:hypothetical protein
MKVPRTKRRLRVNRRALLMVSKSKRGGEEHIQYTQPTDPSKDTTIVPTSLPPPRPLSSSKQSLLIQTLLPPFLNRHAIPESQPSLFPPLRPPDKAILDIVFDLEGLAWLA